MRFQTISARELDRFVEDERILIVDLREAEEYQKGHIKGAINMDYEEINFNNVSLAHDKIIIMYCERGGLSLMAAKRLSAMGYRIVSVIGGLKSYRGKNLV